MKTIFLINNFPIKKNNNKTILKTINLKKYFLA